MLHDQKPSNREASNGKISVRNRAFALLPWACVLSLAAAVRLVALNAHSYWLDEILDVYTVRYPWDRILGALRDGVYNPPLDYILRKVVETLGPTDAARRAVGVVWGVGCLAALGALVARRAGRQAGLVVALCLALAPFHVRYSQEIRPYSLALFLLCLALLSLDAYLDRPSALRLALFGLAGLATAYTLFLAALVLVLASLALLVEDGFTGDRDRRASVRQFLTHSPAVALAVALGYIPWLPVLGRAVGAAPISAPPPLTWARVPRLMGYFGFSVRDWQPFDFPVALFLALAIVGCVVAVMRFRLGFLVVWGVGGLAMTEYLEQRHSTFDSVFHFIPAGLALTAIAALPIAALLTRPLARPAALVLLLCVVFFDARGLRNYFEHGRPDWRPVARLIRATPVQVPVFVDTDYTRLCLGYYVDGPDWLCCGRSSDRVINLVDLATMSGTSIPPDAWVVVRATPQLSAFAGALGESGGQTYLFPDAEFPEGVVAVRAGHLAR